MPRHFSDVICPFRGTFINYGSPIDAGWSDERCRGPQCAMWIGGLTHVHGDTESPAGACALGHQLSQTLIATDPDRGAPAG